MALTSLTKARLKVNEKKEKIRESGKATGKCRNGFVNKLKETIFHVKQVKN